MQPYKTTHHVLANPSKITQALAQSAQIKAIGSAGRISIQSYEIERIVKQLKAETITPAIATTAVQSFSIRVIDSIRVHKPIDSGGLYAAATQWKDFDQTPDAPPTERIGGDCYTELDDETNARIEAASSRVQYRQVNKSIVATNEYTGTGVDLVICRVPLPHPDFSYSQFEKAPIVASVFSEQATRQWVEQVKQQIFPNTSQNLPVSLYRLVNGCLDWGDHSNILQHEQGNWIRSEILLKPRWSEAIAVRVLHLKTQQIAPIIQKLNLGLQSNSNIFNAVAIEPEELQEALDFFQAQIHQEIRALQNEWINNLEFEPYP